MNRRRTRQLVTGTAVALLAAGGGVAYAASGDSGQDRRERSWAPGPGAYGYALPAEPPAPPEPGEHGRRSFHIECPGAPLEGAADYLGLTERQLFEQLGDGRTLAEIARAQGRSVDGLKDALLDAARERLDDAVENGPLTEQQRDEILEGLQERIDDLIAGRLPERLPHLRGDDPRFKGFGGGCGPFGDRGGDEDRGRAAPGEDDEGRGRAAPRREDGEQDGSTTPGSWDGAASSAVTA